MVLSYLRKIKKIYTKKSQIGLNFPFYDLKDQEYVGAESYKDNAIIHRCISLIATSASHVPWQVIVNCKAQHKIVSEHPAMKLLKQPNFENSGADFFIENLSNLLLYGDSYMIINYDNGNKKFKLYNIHPLNVSLSKDNKVMQYKVTIGDSVKIYEASQHNSRSQILHLKSYNPNNSQHGLSALSAAASSVKLYKKILNWNKSLLNNSIRPSGTLMFENGEGYLSEEQFERLKEQFYENFSGSNNSGKPLILEGGLKWQEISHSEKFEKFIELKDSVARDIAIAFNIPPQLLGINGDNTYSNMQEARLALWEENIIPLLDKYADALSGWLSYWYQEDLTIDFDKDSISALSERREALWNKISKADFMTINEKRKLAGLPRLKNGDDLNIKSNMNETDLR
ncbi:MAG: phage portal protein [Rickettsiaceae bacterium]|nr:phage portal protein [Rickettsiaceae bacterium]